ncbi:MAG: tetratricopeptide repeat protein [Xanthomonadales bacterium]|nr:tetratricopeptide repeat protein [Xanthomonadales bacterium]
MQRRKVFRVTAAYAVVAFIILQLGEITFDPLQLPDWSLTALIVAVVLGFPLVVALSWIFELTPEGIRREKESAHSRSGLSFILLASVILLDGALGYYLYRVYAPGVMSETEQEFAPLAATGTAPAGADARPPGSIAVLSFTDLSPSQDQNFFAQGIAEELRSVLGKVEGLRVTADTSYSLLQAQNRTVMELGQLLNVAWILQGSVRRDGDSVRVTAQLVDATDGIQKWAERFDGEVVNTLEIQDQIASEIVTQMLGSAEGLVDVMDDGSDIASLAAYDTYVEARYHWRKRTPRDLERAVELFKQTIGQDAAYAKAYAGLASSYLLQTSYGNLSVPEAVVLAEPEIYTALKLDGQSSDAFASLGLMNWMLGRKVQAEDAFRRALEFDPDNLDAVNWLGGVIGSQGRLGEERLVLNRALELNAADPLVNINIAGIDFKRGDYSAGMDRLDHQLTIYPDSTLLLRAKAGWKAAYGQYEEAHQLLNRAYNLSPEEPATLAMLAHLYLHWGSLDQAKPLVDAALAIGSNNVEVDEAYTRFLLMAGRNDELKSHLGARLERLGPIVGSTMESLAPYHWLGRISLQEGEADQAVEYFGAVLQRDEILVPGYAANAFTWSAAAYQSQGDSDMSATQVNRARQMVERLKVQGVRDPGLTYLEAAISALSGNADDAIGKLGAALEFGWGSAWEASNDARLASLQAEPRFQGLVDGLRQRSATQVSRVLAAGGGEIGASYSSYAR